MIFYDADTTPRVYKLSADALIIESKVRQVAFFLSQSIASFLYGCHLQIIALP